ncbi:MAG: GNAT family N-acetyltransferase [Calditrichaeota bacterium]|nr:GNAT family N-acetyltransferase [Calditrichota bacterium]
MNIVEITVYTDDLLKAVNRLLPQLSYNVKPVSESYLKKIIESDSTFLFIAEDNNNISGMLTLIMAPIPSGIRAVIEDVVVDETFRGKGIGRKLTEAAIEKARKAGAAAINLTSHPSRTAANKLYQKMGFILRETNVYKMDLVPK